MRKTPIKKVNRARRNREFERAYRSPAFVAYTRASPSVVSGRSPCVCAHVTPNDDPPSGMGRKADAGWVVPITADEERELHQMGRWSFEAKHGRDLGLDAMAHWSRWRVIEAAESETLEY